MVTWADLVAHFRPGDVLQPLVGGSPMTVESVCEERICIRQRLWTACITPADIAVALAVLAESPCGITPIQLAERIRGHPTAGLEVVTECSRVPHLATVLLHNVGVL